MYNKEKITDVDIVAGYNWRTLWLKIGWYVVWRENGNRKRRWFSHWWGNARSFANELVGNSRNSWND
jgi:hypothetical protein